jgi:hypothetical protein
MKDSESEKDRTNKEQLLKNVGWKFHPFSTPNL